MNRLPIDAAGLTRFRWLVLIFLKTFALGPEEFSHLFAESAAVGVATEPDTAGKGDRYRDAERARHAKNTDHVLSSLLRRPAKPS